MKTKALSTLLITLIFVSSAFSQAELNVRFSLIDGKGSPLSSTKITLIETQTNEKLEGTTDHAGSVSFKITTGDKWSVNFLDVDKYTYVKMPDEGIVTMSKTLIYSKRYIEQMKRVAFDRTNIKFEIVDQSGIKKFKAQKDSAYVRVTVVNKSQRPLENIKVYLVSVEEKKKYYNETNFYGQAFFYVTPGKEYEVDVDEEENSSNLKTKDDEYFLTGITVVYEQTKINEKNVNDTITQIIPNHLKKPTSARGFITIELADKEKKYLPDENVYVADLNSDTVFKTVTNSYGQAFFLLPKGRSYMVHLEYQKDIDIINLKKTSGLMTGSMKITYKPNPKLAEPEKFIPTPEYLFVKEFNEFMTSELPKPEKKTPLKIVANWSNSVINQNSKYAILEIGITSSDAWYFERNKDPLNIAFVLDKSGSMDGYDRMIMLKKSMKMFIDSLGNEDLITIVAFNHETELICTTQSKPDGNLYESVDKLEPGGMTNIYNGMIEGYEKMQKGSGSKYENKIIILTDGYGETEPKVFVDKAKQIADRGYEITTIGVGHGYNQSLLKLIATECGGRHYSVEDAVALPESFMKELGNIFAPVAKNVKVEVKYDKSLQFIELFGFRARNKEEGMVYFYPGTLSPGYQRLAFMKFKIDKPKKSITSKPVKITVSYYDQLKKERVTETLEASLEWKDDDGNVELLLDRERKKLYAIATMNQALKVMADAYESKNMKQVKETLESTLAEMKELFPDADDEDVQSLINELELYLKRVKGE